MPFDGVLPGYPVTWGQKPVQWAWRMEALHPVARGILRGCAVLMPLWDGRNGAHDVLHPAEVWTPSSVLQSWQGTSRGMSSGNTSTSFGHFSRSPSRLVTSAGDGTGDMTIMAMSSARADAGLFTGLIGHAMGGETGQCYLLLNYNAGTVSGAATFFTHEAATGSSMVGTNAGLVDGTPHTWLGVRAGTNHTLYADGLSIAGPSSLTVRDITPGTDTFLIGIYGTTVGTSVLDPIWLVAVWNRALTDGEARFVTRYPFSLILPRPRYELMVGPVAAPAGGNLFVNLAGSGGLAGTGGLAGVGGGLVG